MRDYTSRRTFVKLLLGGAAAAMLPLPGKARGAQSKEGAVRHSTFVMGQLATITAFGAPEPVLREAINDAFAALRRVDALMSVFSETSDIGKINAFAGKKEIEVDPWTIEAVTAAIDFAKRTNGVFDPTVEPLMRVWGFREPRSAKPSDREIAIALDAVGIQRLAISPMGPIGLIALATPNAKLDLGGIAVGFAVDRAAACLKSHGVTCALIDVSGDLYAIGAPPDSNGWQVGIVDPLHTDSIITTLTIRDQALCTSGNYESFVEYDAQKFGHVLDLHNGYPAHALSSATVIAPTTIMADALSKPAFVDRGFVLPEGKIVRVTNGGEIC